MRHRKKRYSLNRFTSWRKATLISLSSNLLIYQKIRTTKTKAKAARPLVERLISLGKKDDLASRRRAFSILQDHKLVQLLFTDIAPLFSNRNGGYCRILSSGFRRGDGAQTVILELTEKRAEGKKALKKPETPTKLKKELPKTAIEPIKKPSKEVKPKSKFLGGLRKIFKKDKDTK